MATKSIKDRIARNKLVAIKETPIEQMDEILDQLRDIIPDNELFETLAYLLKSFRHNNICPKCKTTSNFRHVDTQTNFPNTNSLSYLEGQVDINESNSNSLAKTLPLGKRKQNENVSTAKKRKRKRRVFEPKGVKTSAAAYILEQKLKKQTQPIVGIIKPTVIYTSNDSGFFERDLEIDYNSHGFCHQNKSEGLLPIHYTIVNNQKAKFDECLKFWTSLDNVDLNNYDLLLTDDDMDCLQLAVMHDCLPSIVQGLLNANFSTETFDAHYNSIIHLAIISDIQMESFDLLLNRTRWEILLEKNDKGFTTLHLAVHENRFLHAERILNKMDEIFQNRIYFKSMIDVSETDFNKQVKQFSKFYEDICMNLNSPINVPLPKRMLLDSRETCSGRTALGVCIEYKLDHLAFFLLAHMADPMIENYFYLSPLKYFSEFCKTNRLNLKVDSAMGKINEFLNSSQQINHENQTIADAL